MEDTAPVLNAAEARLLGCLIEKEATTPETYPLTVNAAQAAARIAHSLGSSLVGYSHGY